MANDNDLFFTCSLIDNNLYFTCSLIEFIGREKKLKRCDVVQKLGKENITQIYNNAEKLHYEPIAKTADIFSEMCGISEGDFDNIASCEFTVPYYWAIGNVYSLLIEDVCDDDIIETLIEVYNSKFSDIISNYNSDLYYQSRRYIREYYKACNFMLNEAENSVEASIKEMKMRDYRHKQVFKEGYILGFNKGYTKRDKEIAENLRKKGFTEKQINSILNGTE